MERTQFYKTALLLAAPASIRCKATTTLTHPGTGLRRRKKPGTKCWESGLPIPLTDTGAQSSSALRELTLNDAVKVFLKCSPVLSHRVSEFYGYWTCLSIILIDLGKKSSFDKWGKRGTEIWSPKTKTRQSKSSLCPRWDRDCTHTHLCKQWRVPALLSGPILSQLWLKVRLHSETGTQKKSSLGAEVKTEIQPGMCRVWNT